jgi:hypothetical protein
MDVSLSNSSVEDDELTILVNFLAKKIQSAMSNIFKVDSQVGKVIIRRLVTHSEYIPYESLSDKYGLGPNPTVAILPLGSARPFNLKKNARVTHKIPLFAGSLTVLSGDTSRLYTHSIPRGEGSLEVEQLVLFFIGSPVNTSCDFARSLSGGSSSSAGMSESDLDSETDNRSRSSAADDRGEIQEFSLLDPQNPSVKITPAESPGSASSNSLPQIAQLQLTGNDERLSDILQSDKLEVEDTEDNQETSQCSLSILHPSVESHPSHSPDVHEADKTMIPATDGIACIRETMVSGIFCLPINQLNRELLRHGCDTTGSEAEKRERLSNHLSSRIRLLTQNTHLYQHQDPKVQSMIESTLIDIKTQMKDLAVDVSLLKQDKSEPSTTTQKYLETIDKEVKKSKDLWHQNLATMNLLKSRIESAAKVLDNQKANADELDDNFRKLKCELKGWYNSAFFREDSELIKDIHAKVTNSHLIRGHRPWPINNTHEDFPPLPNNSTGGSAPQSRRSSGFTMTSSAHAARPRSPGPREQLAPVTRHSRPPPAEDVQRQFKTTLITDSILRHVTSMDTPNVLGVNHHLSVINKTDLKGLVKNDVKTTLLNQKPDFIYVHLGVNDVSQEETTDESIARVGEFFVYTEHYLPNTKVIVSLPDGDPVANAKIKELRSGITQLIGFTETAERNKDRRLLLNVNYNFMRDGVQVQEFFDHGRTHLSDRGKDVLLGNFRHVIHDVTRDIQGKPPKPRRGSTPNSSQV